MLQKRKYFAYICHKWKNKGHDSNPGCCARKPLLLLCIPPHLDLFSHAEESVSWSLPSSGPLGVRHGCLHPASSETLRSSPKQAVCQQPLN